MRRKGGVDHLEALEDDRNRLPKRCKGEDLSGKRFGFLVVKKKIKIGYGKYKWLCECDCGGETLVNTYHLKEGDIKSCGCQHFKACVTHGMTNTRLYHIWRTMKSRCNCKSSPKYSSYGGRGIKLYNEWNRFEPFRDWALANGYSEELSIDRIDNDGNYEPSNCRWATAIEQANNTRKNRRIAIHGEERTLKQWCDIYGIESRLVSQRLKRGWSVEDALTIPKGYFPSGKGRGYKQMCSTGR